MRFLCIGATELCQWWDPRAYGCQVSPAVAALLFFSCIQVFRESAFLHKLLAEDKGKAKNGPVEGIALECLCGLYVKFFGLFMDIVSRCKYLQVIHCYKKDMFLTLIRLISSNIKIPCVLG